MAGPHWLDRLDTELRKHNLPAGYRARMLEELADHFSDLEQENASMDAPLLLEERLGNPREVAATARSAYDARTFAGRHPVLTFGLIPVFAVIATVIGTVLVAWCAVWLASMTTPSLLQRTTPPTTLQWCAVYGATYFVRIVPFVLTAWMFAHIARRIHQPRWGLLACAIIAGVAFVFFVRVREEPGQFAGQVFMGLAVHMGSALVLSPEQWLQAALPLAIGLWTWRSMIRRDRVSLMMANTM